MSGTGGDRAAGLPPALIGSLIAVGRAMRPATDPWWVIGSSAAALHGARPVDVADVDVLLTPSDARRILPALGLVVVPGHDDPRFRSTIFATWDRGDVPIEFMAGFRYRGCDGWHDVIFRSRDAVQIDDAVIYVPSRRELATMLRRFARPKDLARAALLDDVS